MTFFLRPGALLTGAALTLALAACTSGTAAETTASGDATGQFPVTITHALGTTTVEAAPERIVTLGDADLDTLLALGLQPVGVAASSGEDGITAWAAPHLTSSPTVLEAGDEGYDVEDILALEPDLVLAGSDYYVDHEYQALTDAGVPVTAYEQGPAEDSWQTTVRQVAAAVGEADAGETLVTQVEAQITDVTAQHPELEGATFSLTQMWEAGSIGVLRSGEDAGVKMLGDFGMELAPDVAALEGDEFATQLSLEKLGTLEADVLLVYYADPALQQTLEANSVFTGLQVVQDGGYVALTQEQFSALRVPTPLSVPYTVTTVVPLLVDAAAATA